MMCKQDGRRVTFGPKEWLAYGAQFAVIVAMSAVAMHRLRQVEEDGAKRAAMVDEHHDELERIQATLFTDEEAHQLETKLTGAVSDMRVQVEEIKGLNNRTADKIDMLDRRMVQVVDAINNIERALPPSRDSQ